MPSFIHPLDPIFNESSKILILGTFPSFKSRELGFYYSHPQNRFWKILAYLTYSEIPITIQDKKQLLIKNNIALWDVIKSCDIEGSSDETITNVIPTDLSIILNTTAMKQIFTNGNKAYQIYKKHHEPHISIDVQKLPSSSPANASYSFEKLIKEWQIIMQYNV